MFNLRRLLEENNFLRKIAAVAPIPCLYCKLPAADMTQCAYGFPGCNRADDLNDPPPPEPPLDLQTAIANFENFIARNAGSKWTPDKDFYHFLVLHRDEILPLLSDIAYAQAKELTHG